MAVSLEYRRYVLDQLGRVLPVHARSMFGGIGIYSTGVFFALASDDVLYFKVDPSNRGDFEAAGMPPFRPYGSTVLSYYEVPVEVLEDEEQLKAWAQRALAVARRTRAVKTGRKTLSERANSRRR